MKYYKVVNHDKESCIANGMEGITVQYSVGEWTKPVLEGSKLFAFDGLRTARQFIGNNVILNRHGMELWECEVQQPSNSGAFSMFAKPEAIISKWKQPCGRQAYIGPPVGTVFVEAVRLTKLIETHDKE